MTTTTAARTSARTKPPFRADHVGSFLRPAALKEARAKREKGEITPAQLKEVEDREIEKIIRKQEEIGLKLATDGEFRRSWWHFDFFGMLDGVDLFETDTRHPVSRRADQGAEPAHRRQARLLQPPDARALQVPQGAHQGHAEDDHPGAAGAALPARPDGIDKTVYPDIDGFFDDLGQAYKQAVKAFYDAGCRYLQFDDTVWAYLCSQEELRKARERDVERRPAAEHLRRRHQHGARRQARRHDRSPPTSAAAISARPGFRKAATSRSPRPCSARCNYDGYFLEYDTERAGGFEPLRFLPKGNKIVVLGLVTSKSGTLEKKDDIKRRIDEAAKFAPLDQFCLSPQCGFASTEEGNVLTEDEQWAKLRMIVEIADEVWGK